MRGVLAVLAAVQVASPQAAPGQAPSALELRQLARTPATLRFGLQRPDLVRYNRVEGLSVGVRGQLRPTTALGPLSLTATARIGVADWHPNGRLEVVHESIRRRVALSAYHDLSPIDEAARHLGPANSLMALLYGQDDGDYYRASGATLELTPPSARPRTYRLSIYGEYHEGVAKETDVQLERIWNDDVAFRPNLAADDGWELGAAAQIEARSSTDPRRTQVGLRAYVQAATGEFDFARASAEADLALALPARFRLVLEGGGGSSWGSPSAQRLWYVGGPMTLHGYSPTVAGGRRFGRGRAELDRRTPFGRVIAFLDAAWAGAPGQFDFDDALSSVGGGVALIDGIVRVDVARQLESPHEYRLDIYLDDLP